ncbi:MAG: hypothetical protein QGF12_03130 [SAR202 cluster bacterium]|jgi:hypothetical protein|nr:hypothetical protein [SAR202 cluster bacterium]
MNVTELMSLLDFTESLQAHFVYIDVTIRVSRKTDQYVDIFAIFTVYLNRRYAGLEKLSVGVSVHSGSLNLCD